MVIVIALLVAVYLERTGRLPEPAAQLVREVEVTILSPFLERLGFKLPTRDGPSRPDVSPEAPGSNIDVAQARHLLSQIQVRPEHRGGYVREQWPHWLDADGDCLNARDEVLAAESLEPVRFGRDGCQVIAGRWLDHYTGETVTNPSDLDVDHFVPLEEAHGSGGYEWKRERRAAFANDLSDPRSLVAVTAAANRSKGAQGPEEWLPAQPGYRCRYVADWIEVKARWRLSMDERERMAVGNLLDTCQTTSS